MANNNSLYLLSIMQSTVKNFTCLISFTLWSVGTIINSVLQVRKLSLENIDNLSSVTQLTSAKAGIQPHVSLPLESGL